MRDDTLGDRMATSPMRLTVLLLVTLLALLASATSARAFCGDGILDPDEACDDGNQSNNDCCRQCNRVAADGKACNDGDVCTLKDKCHDGLCGGRGFADDVLPCDDGDPCDGAETCDAVLGCEPGVPPPLVCGDGFKCGGESCDDGNVTDGDCCTASCTAVAAATPCPDDALACTTDRCDGTGACIHLPAAPACLDDVMCYTARPRTPFQPVSIGLTTQRATGSGRVVRPHAMCPAARSDGAPLLVPDIHQESYELRHPGTAGLRWEVPVVGAFGSLRLLTGRAERLLLPTALGLDSPPVGPPTPGAADYYECFQAARARRTAALADNLEVPVADQFQSRVYALGRLKYLCHPVAANGSTIVKREAHLLCFGAAPARGQPPHTPLIGRLFTANGLGVGRLDTVKETELCMAALEASCSVPECKRHGRGQLPFCRYEPVVAAPAFPFCSGPTILVDRTHGNFHQIEPISRELPGRYWGFARLLATDGYVVRDTDVPIASLLPTTEARVLVIANAQTGGTNPAEDAVGPADVAAIAAWVASGGSLLLVLDHRPFERLTSLLAAFGIDRLFDGNVPRHTFKRTLGDLNGASEIANGPDSSRAVATFTTFTGTAFSISATPPAGASYEPVLTLPSGVSGSSGSDSLDVGGLLQGVAIHFGSGRVYVAGEAGGLTVQTSIQGLRKNPGNEGLLRNILWWLTS